MSRMLDKSTPVEGRVWYCGRWRTPEQAEKCRDRMRHYLRRRREEEPSFRERDRERAAGYRRARGAKPSEVAREEAETRRAVRMMRAAERRRAAVAREREGMPERAPADVRAAWRDGKPNSIIRRKFPRMTDLDASARRGEFDRWK